VSQPPPELLRAQSNLAPSWKAPYRGSGYSLRVLPFRGGLPGSRRIGLVAVSIDRGDGWRLSSLVLDVVAGNSAPARIAASLGLYTRKPVLPSSKTL
jgi:hypothetical protein